MAFASLQRFSSQISRVSSISLYSKVVVTRSSTTSAPTSNPSLSKKVADQIVNLFAIDPKGENHQIIGLSGQTLFKALTYHGLIDPASYRLGDIDPCTGECEVNIVDGWLYNLPRHRHGEKCVLKQNTKSSVLSMHSRLGCQVVLTSEFEGMLVTIPTPKPWDTPEDYSE
ncbi:uncharacterized protein LOC122668486 [Telopea speciosissima]|uniref:uncharacterized protein LOC122668486 n=1 Tax=Telopea speciosissima TaxID=54955 RepID=UPI001CC37A50|nr:uncharacterized protein LOC122668486 [Telopea speciosissima]